MTAAHTHTNECRTSQGALLPTLELLLQLTSHDLTRVPTLQKAVAWWGRQVRAEAWAVASKMLVRVRDGQGLMVSDHYGLGADLTLLAQ